MHPIERLRWVARASGAPASVLAQEAAGALMGFADEPAGLVTACRRMVQRQPSAGVIAWLAARALTAPDPGHEMREALREIERDQTTHALSYALPDDAKVTVLGQQSAIARALFARGDLSTHIVDVLGEGRDLAWALDDAGTNATVVRPEGIGVSAAGADLVVIEASAAGPTEALAITGARSAAAVASAAGVEVWLVAGVGTFLPERMWRGLLDRCDRQDDPWDRDDEVVPLSLVSKVVGPAGLGSVAAAVASTSCPVAPELFT